jgi:hypothetical protein
MTREEAKAAKARRRALRWYRKNRKAINAKRREEYRRTLGNQGTSTAAK